MSKRNNKGQFVKGTSLNAAEKLAMSRALSEAWNNRADYIGDLVNKCPKIYNCWRGIVHSEKGKKIGFSEEWKDFRTFFNDVYPTYGDGLVFRRKNMDLPYSKDNFSWVTLDEAGDIKSFIVIAFNGKEMNLKQWSNEIGVPYSAIKNRYYRHKDDYSAEEILFGRKIKRNNRPAKDADGNEYIKAARMVSSYKCKDKKHGFENECDITASWMVKMIFHSSCVYCGDTHKLGCDRIDNTKPHTMDNVVPCCVECNTARNNNFSF